MKTKKVFVDEFCDSEMNRVVDVLRGSQLLFRAVFTPHGVRTEGDLILARDFAEASGDKEVLQQIDKLDLLIEVNRRMLEIYSAMKSAE
jgi:hypothetical protein